eukprot:8624536-Heterocapsa_arctica.AAC.1
MPQVSGQYSTEGPTCSNKRCSQKSPKYLSTLKLLVALSPRGMKVKELTPLVSVFIASMSSKMKASGAARAIAGQYSPKLAATCRCRSERVKLTTPRWTIVGTMEAFRPARYPAEGFHLNFTWTSSQAWAWLTWTHLFVLAAIGASEAVLLTSMALRVRLCRSSRSLAPAQHSRSCRTP